MQYHQQEKQPQNYCFYLSTSHQNQEVTISREKIENNKYVKNINNL